jgi:Ca2+/H+ antiporter
MTRRDVIELGLSVMLVGITAACNFGGAPHVVTFIVAAITLAILARQVGTATEQLGARLGSGAAGVVQSALGNLPELFIALFALHAGLFSVVQSALVGSVLANSVLVLGIAFTVGGIKNGTQRFDSDRARMISTLALVAAATMAIPSLAHEFHTPAAPHGEALSLICGGVLLVLFLLTLPSFIRSTGDETHEPALVTCSDRDRARPRRPRRSVHSGLVHLRADARAAHAAHEPGLRGPCHRRDRRQRSRERGRSAIRGAQPARLRDLRDHELVAAGVARADAATRVRVAAVRDAPDARVPDAARAHLVIASILGAFVVNDGRSTWQEGAVLVGFYVVIASSFWWGT